MKEKIALAGAMLALGLFIAATLAVHYQRLSVANQSSLAFKAEVVSSKGVSEFVNATTREPVAFFTFCLTISTVGLWLVTWRASAAQARDMKSSIEAARDAVSATEGSVRVAERTAERQLRAYLAVEGAGPIAVVADKPVVLKLIVKNVGQTPAHDVTVATGSVLRGSQANWREPDWNLATTERPRVLLMPTTHHAFEVASNDPHQNWVPDDRNVENIRMGNQRIFLFGQITYRDSISPEKERYTRFQYEIDENAMRLRMAKISAFGNSAT